MNYEFSIGDIVVCDGQICEVLETSPSDETKMYLRFLRKGGGKYCRISDLKKPTSPEDQREIDRLIAGYSWQRDEMQRTIDKLKGAKN